MTGQGEAASEHGDGACGPSSLAAADSGARPGCPRCRFCAQPIGTVVLDLGASPLANSYLELEALDRPEVHYPLRVLFCESCGLVQLPAVESAQAIFSDYAYFSSFSDSWLRHAEDFVASAVKRLGLGADSLVIEVASNDGYLLQYVERRGIPCLGVEPATNVARAASARGIPTLNRFLGAETGRAIVEGDREALALADDELDQGAARRLGRPADLVVGNNVFAHVPDLDDFCRGLKALLSPRGALSLEFPHLYRLLDEAQFDTIYHEHFSYFSFATACRILEHQGLEVFDVEELPTHGGSLRVWARRRETAADDLGLATTPRVEELLERERRAGLGEAGTYRSFADRVMGLKLSLLRFLLDARERGLRVAAYGAPAKGNTLLNYCGVDDSLIDFTVDRSPHKQGRFLPGSRIAISAPERLLEERPDYVLILPWNLKAEIVAQMSAVEEWGGRFVVAVPEVSVHTPEGWRPARRAAKESVGAGGG